MRTQAERFLRLYGAHLVGDFFVQDEWQARHKADLRSPALAVHAGLVAWLTWTVAPWWLALLHGVAHAAIDSRRPLAWWRGWARQTTTGPAALPFALAQDQAAHVLTLVALAWLWARQEAST
jgi:hypothetical protein